MTQDQRLVTVITEFQEAGATDRLEYSGVLIDESHAFYVDADYGVAILERVRRVGDEYHTTGGPGAVSFEIDVADTSFIGRLPEMSATELLRSLIRG